MQTGVGSGSSGIMKPGCQWRSFRSWNAVFSAGRSRAFSIVELLVAVAVVGISTTVGMLAIGNSLRVGVSIAEEAGSIHFGEEALVMLLLRGEPVDGDPDIPDDGFLGNLTSAERFGLSCFFIRSMDRKVIFDQWCYSEEPRM